MTGGGLHKRMETSDKNKKRLSSDQILEEFAGMMKLESIQPEKPCKKARPDEIWNVNKEDEQYLINELIDLAEEEAEKEGYSKAKAKKIKVEYEMVGRALARATRVLNRDNVSHLIIKGVNQLLEDTGEEHSDLAFVPIPRGGLETSGILTYVIGSMADTGKNSRYASQPQNLIGDILKVDPDGSITYITPSGRTATAKRIVMVDDYAGFGYTLDRHMREFKNKLKEVHKNAPNVSGLVAVKNKNAEIKGDVWFGDEELPYWETAEFKKLGISKKRAEEILRYSFEGTGGHTIFPWAMPDNVPAVLNFIFERNRINEPYVE